MKRLLSLIVCILLITGGTAETADSQGKVEVAGSEPPAAVMLSESVIDQLLDPSAGVQEGQTDTAGLNTANDDLQVTVEQHNLSAADLDLLARLVQAEAGSEPFNGKVAIAATVLNRLESVQYPDTIPGVIYQQHQYCPVRNGMINRPAGDDARRAVQEALRGKDPTGGALSFYNPAKATNSWIRTRPVHIRIGRHLFVR